MIKVFFCARCSLLSAPWARDTMPEYYDSDEVEDEDRIDAEPEPESPATPLTVPKSTRTRPRATPHSWPHHICALRCVRHRRF